MDSIMQFIFGSADASFAEVMITLGVRVLIILCILPIHEFAHGWMAYRLGDETAKNAGRLTLNPFAHLDLLGSGLLLVAGFGYAKPVPVNPFRFKNQSKRRQGMALTAFAGPASNLIMALLFSVIFCIVTGFLPTVENASLIQAYNGFSAYEMLYVRYLFAGGIWEYVFVFLTQFIIINVSLAVFNMLPIPPLDGSRIFGLLFPEKWTMMIERYSSYFILGIFIVFNYIIPGALSNIILRVFYVVYDIIALVFNIFGAGLPIMW